MDTWLQLHRRPQLCSIYNHLSGLLNSFTFLLFLFSWWERDRERLIFDFQIKMEDWIYINMFVPIQNFIIRVNWFFKTSSPPRTFFHCFLREREREREREEGREKHRWEREASIGCLLYVPRRGVKPATFWLQDDPPTNWATASRAKIDFLRTQTMAHSMGS